MKFEYELTKQDYIDYNIYHIKNSDTLKRTLFIQQYVLALIYIIIPFILARVTNFSLWYCLIVFVIIAVLWVIFYPKYFISVIIKRTSELVDEGKNQDMLGKHSFTINEEGITDETENGKSRIKWSGIKKVAQTEKHVFIYISSIMAYIIPKQVFENDDIKKNEFFQLLNGRLSNNKKSYSGVSSCD